MNFPTVLNGANRSLARELQLQMQLQLQLQLLVSPLLEAIFYNIA
jgi:hypothetical protein